RAIAKQIRLRDLGGIIVVDFIDLRDEKNKRKVYEELKKEFKKDRAVSKILPMSDFGLVQITRQRLRPSITVSADTPEFVKNGSKKNGARSSREPAAGARSDQPREKPRMPKPVKADNPGRSVDESSSTSTHAATSGVNHLAAGDPAAILSEMEQWLIDYKTLGNRRAVTLRVHPFTAAYLNRKVPNHPTRWFMKHLVRVRLEMDDSVPPLSYRFVDARSGEDLTEKVSIPGSEG